MSKQFAATVFAKGLFIYNILYQMSDLALQTHCASVGSDAPPR